MFTLTYVDLTGFKFWHHFNWDTVRYSSKFALVGNLLVSYP